MPPHDETSPVGRPAGSSRRPPPARAGGSGGSAARRPAAKRPAAKRPAAGSSRSGGGGGRKKKRGPRQRRRRIIAAIAAVLVGGLVLLGVFVGVVYASTSVPSPESIQTKQTTVLYYSDGVTEMARLGTQNRTNVPLDQISQPARDAVLAAENRSFYTDPGISFTGIARAAWSNLTGGSTQGGSTITQQYVKKAILKNSSQTFSRKFKELFLAVKLDNSYSKNQILQNYLNTIYFGRGAYGIEAAANTYFGVPAANLTAEQGAVLAVLIRNPSAYDPANDPKTAQNRWGLVLDGMVKEGWLDGAKRAAMVYPPVLPKADSTLGVPSGPEGLIVSKVLSELTNTDGYSDVAASGLRVVTTVNKNDQNAAVSAVNDVMRGEDTDVLRQALVAVDPKTGGVLAYYGGPKGAQGADGKPVIDYAQALKPPGSSFKPYTLATALAQGISDDARRDGSSPQTFSDRTQPVRNAGTEGCDSCTLKEAITQSLNTTFYGLALEVGGPKVAATARAATGIPDVWPDKPAFGTLAGKPSLTSADGVTGSSIGIGEYEVQPIDQAVGFATFANGGTYHAAHFVASVTDNGGTKRTFDGSHTGKQVISPDVANDVTYALEGVAAFSHRSLAGNRPVASKTGTQGKSGSTVDDTDAWMVGYTPSISTAVWMGTDGNSEAITNAQGRPIYGSGLPGAIWQKFMNTVLAGTPVEKLPSHSIIKGDTGHGVAAPTQAAPTTKRRAPVTTTEAPATTTEAPATTGAPDSSAPTVPVPTGTAPGTTTPRRPGDAGCGQPGQPVCPPTQRVGPTG